MIVSNLAYGAQACYRGPRLYDCDEVRAMVTRWVDWYKRYRDVLESDVIHGSSRRADGRGLDWVLHANPRTDPRAMLVVFNPGAAAMRRGIPLDLYFAGLSGRVEMVDENGLARELQLDARACGVLEVEVPAGSQRWFAFR